MQAAVETADSQTPEMWIHVLFMPPGCFNQPERSGCALPCVCAHFLNTIPGNRFDLPLFLFGVFISFNYWLQYFTVIGTNEGFAKRTRTRTALIQTSLGLWYRALTSHISGTMDKTRGREFTAGEITVLRLSGGGKIICQRQFRQLLKFFWYLVRCSASTKFSVTVSLSWCQWYTALNIFCVFYYYILILLNEGYTIITVWLSAVSSPLHSWHSWLFSNLLVA